MTIRPETPARTTSLLRQSCLVSANGVISEPVAWAGPHFGAGSAAGSLAALKGSRGLLMGRRTYEIFAAQWPHASGEYADYVNAMPKYVFSSTLRSADWNNTTVVAGDVAAAVAGHNDGLASLTYRPTEHLA